MAKDAPATLARQIDFSPRPPKEDVLDQPLTLERPPDYTPPPEPGFDVGRLLQWMGLAPGRDLQRQAEHLHVATARAIAAVSPTAASKLKASGWLRRKGLTSASAIPAVDHPYVLRDTIQTMMRAPRDFQSEQRFLELLMAMILRHFTEAISRQTSGRFAFDLESQEYMLQATRSERMIKRASSPDERLDMLQKLYEQLYHGRNYYAFSVIARERSLNQGKLFILYCNAAHTLARIQSNGSLQESPARARLPTRREVLFLFKRDRCLLQRCAEDQTFADQVKALIRTFPVSIK